MIIASQIFFWMAVAYIWIMAFLLFIRPADNKPQTWSAKMIESAKVVSVAVGLMVFSEFVKRVA